MYSVRADFPTDWPHANIYTLADLHIGDPHCSTEEVFTRVEQIKNDPYGLCVCNGDLMNTALRNSVSDVYGELLTPMEQKHGYFRTDSSNCKARMVTRLFVNTGAALEYGGYGQSQEYKPASLATPFVKLEAKQKRMSATM